MRLIKELFDSPVSYKIEMNSGDRFVAKFEIGDLKFSFDANREYSSMAGTTDSDRWEVEFSMLEDFGSGHMRTFGITDTGHAATVFSTVKQIFEEFLMEVNPELFIFTAKEKSRIKLYTTFAHQIAKTHHYKLEIKQQYGETYYYFRDK